LRIRDVKGLRPRPIRSLPAKRRDARPSAARVKRDCGSVVKVTTEGGLVGLRRVAIHGRAQHGRFAQLVKHDACASLFLGMDAADVVGCWKTGFISRQLAEPRPWARGCAMAMSGHRHGAVGHPRQGDGLALCTSCSAGAQKPVAGLRGAASLARLPREAVPRWSMKCSRIWRPGLQGGQAACRRIHRRAILARNRGRCAKAVGDDIDILTDANTAYTGERRARP